MPLNLMKTLNTPLSSLFKILCKNDVLAGNLWMKHFGEFAVCDYFSEVCEVHVHSSGGHGPIQTAEGVVFKTLS